jgi:hypothetical protein
LISPCKKGQLEKAGKGKMKAMPKNQLRRYTRASQGKCPGKKAFALVVALPEILPTWIM